MSWGPRCPGLLRIILLILVVRPAAAHFAAAEAAEQRGDLATAYQACKTDAEAGDARCQNYLGVMSKTRPPRGAGRRRGGASLPPRRRAGPCRSAIQSGTCVCSGPRVRKNPAEASRWYRMAAEQGDPAAQNALAILDATGRGVLRDPEAALALFRRAATNGYALAQLNLAVAFEDGRLMPRDPLRAYIWYSIAARLAPDQTLRDKAAQGRDRLMQKISLRSKRQVSLRDPGPRAAEVPTKD